MTTGTFPTHSASLLFLPSLPSYYIMDQLFPLLKPTPLHVHISHLLCLFKYFNSNFSTYLGYPSSSFTESFHQHANIFCIILIPFLFPVSPFLTPCPSQLLPISLLPFLLNSMKSCLYSLTPILVLQFSLEFMAKKMGLGPHPSPHFAKFLWSVPSYHLI